MNSPAPKVSIVILDFLKSRRVLQNVASLQAQQVLFPLEIIVADNSCNAANAERLRKLEKFGNVRIVFNTKNLGYTRGTNAGARYARGDYILILNPDIIWRDAHTLQSMVDYMDAHPQIGILGPRQVDDPTGATAMTVRAFPRLITQVARRTWLRQVSPLRQMVAYDEMQHLDYTQIQPVDWLQSSCILVRKNLWEEVGGLDERYFLFMSDPEICWQAWVRGYEVVYYPEVAVYADGLRVSSGGFGTFLRRWVLRQHLLDAITYRLHHLGEKNPREKYFAEKKSKS